MGGCRLGQCGVLSGRQGGLRVPEVARQILGLMVLMLVFGVDV